MDSEQMDSYKDNEFVPKEQLSIVEGRYCFCSVKNKSLPIHDTHRCKRSHLVLLSTTLIGSGILCREIVEGIWQPISIDRLKFKKDSDEKMMECDAYVWLPPTKELLKAKAKVTPVKREIPEQLQLQVQSNYSKQLIILDTSEQQLTTTSSTELQLYQHQQQCEEIQFWRQQAQVSCTQLQEFRKEVEQKQKEAALAEIAERKHHKRIASGLAKSEDNQTVMELKLKAAEVLARLTVHSTLDEAHKLLLDPILTKQLKTPTLRGESSTMLEVFPNAQITQRLQLGGEACAALISLFGPTALTCLQSIPADSFTVSEPKSNERAIMFGQYGGGPMQHDTLMDIPSVHTIETTRAFPMFQEAHSALRFMRCLFPIKNDELSKVYFQLPERPESMTWRQQEELRRWVKLHPIQPVCLDQTLQEDRCSGSERSAENSRLLATISKMEQELKVAQESNSALHLELQTYKTNSSICLKQMHGVNTEVFTSRFIESTQSSCPKAATSDDQMDSLTTAKRKRIDD